jgi:hypothetical protein
VVCVDHANDVWKELQRRQHGGAPVIGSPETSDEMVALEVDG